MSFQSRSPAVFGVPNPRLEYNALIRSRRGLVLFWPGPNPIRRESLGNYTMPAQFTMECWFNFSALVQNRGILANWNTNGAMLMIQITTVQLNFQINGTAMLTGVVPVQDAWYHFVGTYDGTNRAAYVNGQLAAGPTGGVTPVSGSTPLITHNYAGSGGGDQVGRVPDAAIYNRALTPAEIAQHYLVGIRPDSGHR